MKRESTGISEKEAKFFIALRDSDGWHTAKELSKLSGVAERTGRMYAAKFVRFGLAELAKAFPCHFYQRTINSKRRDAAYLQRLEQAIEVFGLNKAAYAK